MSFLKDSSSQKLTKLFCVQCSNRLCVLCFPRMSLLLDHLQVWAVFQRKHPGDVGGNGGTDPWVSFTGPPSMAMSTDDTKGNNSWTSTIVPPLCSQKGPSKLTYPSIESQESLSSQIIGAVFADKSLRMIMRWRSISELQLCRTARLRHILAVNAPEFSSLNVL